MEEESNFENAQMSIVGHLQELLVRVKRGVLWLVLGAAVGFAYIDPIMLFLEQPLLDRIANIKAGLVFVTPFEKMWTYMRVSFITGFVIAAPLIFWEIALFIGPGLKKQEKSKIFYLSFWVAIAFILGVIFSYKLALPFVLDAILKGNQVEQPFLSLSSYINMLLGLMLMCVIVFLIPIIMIHLSFWGWVDPNFWSKGRRLSIVANAFVSAILSPPDLMSMFMMMLPIHLLYEVGVIGAKLVSFNRKNRNEKN